MTEESPKGELLLRIQSMPSDVNVNGDIFGGWVLSQMDIASGMVAATRANGRVTTVAVDAMKFIRPCKWAIFFAFTGGSSVWGAPRWPSGLKPGRCAG